MKQTLPNRNAMLCLFLSLTLSGVMSGLHASPIEGRRSGTEPRKNGDSILIFKQVADKSYRVSLYPDANQKVIFFSVKGNDEKSYQLFVFDMDGNMVRQTEIRNKQTTLIKDIEKGIYLFQVFSDDEKIGNGRISVK